ncbi:hypothetical protein [Streptomyces tsukubensis]|uniref:hypothetical protein n=1 Tax=Streptomyces tsukubensis TaxID=83656 RepID=UPI00344EA0E1
MTTDALTSPPPQLVTARCLKCATKTTAPVHIRWLPSPSGPGTTLYACPHCAPNVPHGPTPDEDLTYPHAT